MLASRGNLTPLPLVTLAAVLIHFDDLFIKVQFCEQIRHSSDLSKFRDFFPLCYVPLSEIHLKSRKLC